MAGEQLSDAVETEVKDTKTEAEPDDKKEEATGKEAGGESEQPDARAIEAKAKAIGWVPQDKFKGDPDDWRPAAEWLERGDRMLGWRLRQSEKERTKEARDFAKRIERMEKMHTNDLKRQRAAIERDFESLKRTAVKDADQDAYDKADKEKQAALKALDDQAKPDTEADDAPLKLTARDKEAVAEFHSENPWFKSDRRLTAAMDDHFDDVTRETPGASVGERLAEARRRVEDEFPAKFGKTKTNGSGKVEGGSRVAGGGAAPRLASKLPPEAVAAADKYVSEGLYKSREDYAKAYFAEDNAA